jgi:hypothetical protein
MPVERKKRLHYRRILSQTINYSVGIKMAKNAFFLEHNFLKSFLMELGSREYWVNHIYKTRNLIQSS